MMSFRDLVQWSCAASSSPLVVTSRQARVYNITLHYMPILNYKVNVLCCTVATVAMYAS